MNKSVLLVAAVVVTGLILFLSTSIFSGQTATEEASTIQEVSISLTPEPTQEVETQAMPSNSEWYLEYSDTAIAQATKNNATVVIFFHADWCPTCIAAAEDFKANQDQIPENVVIIKADYDTETELKSTYGVVTQDTFVQVDADGMVVSTWNSGGEGIKSLLSNIQ